MVSDGSASSVIVFIFQVIFTKICMEKEPVLLVL
jgi:hypothetical protein